MVRWIDTGQHANAINCHNIATVDTPTRYFINNISIRIITEKYKPNLNNDE